MVGIIFDRFVAMKNFGTSNLVHVFHTCCNNNSDNSNSNSRWCNSSSKKNTGENPLTDPHVLVLPVVVDEEDRPVVRDYPPVHLRPANGDGERRLGVGLLAKVVLVVVVLGAVGDRAFESFFFVFRNFCKMALELGFFNYDICAAFFSKKQSRSRAIREPGECFTVGKSQREGAGEDGRGNLNLAQKVMYEINLVFLYFLFANARLTSYTAWGR